MRLQHSAGKLAAAFKENDPGLFFAQFVGGNTVIQLDASQRSIVDGFRPEFRGAFLQHLFNAIPANPEIVASFTEDMRKSVYSPVAHKDRHLVLWQDRRQSTDELYRVADQVQILLSNLGFTRYPANILRPKVTQVHEQSRKTSWTDLLKMAFSTKIGLGFERSVDSSKTETESTQITVTKEPDPDAGRWDFTIPYLKEIGKTMDLITPEALVRVSEKGVLRRQLVDNTLDETYQRLRVSEMELSKATARALPDWMRSDKHLVWMLENAYIEEALEIVQTMVESTPDYFNQENMSACNRREMAEAQWALHMILYVGLYRGARQRIENYMVSFVGEGLKEMARSRQWTSVTAEVNRECSEYPMVSSVPLREIHGGEAVYVQRIGVPVRVFVDDAKAVTVTAWPELTDAGINYDTGGSAYAKVRYQPLSDGKPVLVPTDAIAFRRAKEAVMRDLRDGETRKAFAFSRAECPEETEMVLRRDDAENSHDYRNGSSSGIDSMDIPG